MDKVKVGIIGCGNISDIYLKNCTTLFDNVEITAVSDILPERAVDKAKTYGIKKACSVMELLKDPEIRIILNLTIPKEHAAVTMSALNAGKNVYSEKPLGVDRKEGISIMKLAKKKGLKVGCAPDTFLGGGIRTCKKVIDDNLIGKPIAATAIMMCHGHESWHPSPEFYYQKGGGPMLDMGPYYLTALVYLMGPVKRVTGCTQITFDRRTISSLPKAGKVIEVEVPTHVVGVLDFKSRAVASIITSFDVWASNLPFIEIYGTEGTLSVPDPNSFGGQVKIKRFDSSEWSQIPLSFGYSDNSRGIGLSGMAGNMTNGNDFLATGEMACHVLDIMQAIHDSSNKGRHIRLLDYTQ